ncbi:hypothetical protein TNCV_2576571 [Trichonephila clavipes]|nr:hypothetical protein TNCV_2576571 [Trichonephila clavipes]
MTSSTDWSERTDVTKQQPPNSPSRIIAGDDHIAECSDLFREAIQARNVYAAWARKLTNARPNDPMMQSYHQEVTKAEEERGEKAESGFSSSPASPRSKGRKAKRSVDADGFAPPSNLFEKFALLARPPPSPTPSSSPIDSAPLEEQGMDTVDNDLPQTQEEVPVVTKKPRIPPFFVSPKGD